MRGGPSCQIGAIGEQRHFPRCASHASIATHGEGGGEIATGCGGVHRTTGTAASAHRLQKHRHGVVAAGFHAQAGRCCVAAEGDAAAVGAVAAIAAVTRAQSEGHGGVGAGGGDVAAAHDRAALSTTTTNRLQQNAVGAVACPCIGIAREHGQAIGHQQVDPSSAPTIAAISAHGEGG